jgi:glutathione S-transferase
MKKSVATPIALLSALSALTASNALAAPANLELKYFGARGAAETARVILALAEAEYTDTRFEIAPGSFEAPEFKKAKESGDLDANLGRAPLLVVDGAQIGQSKAIERFLAKKFGFMGDSDIEAAQIDCIAEHCRDVKDAQAKKGFSMFTRDKTDEEKAESKKEWYETDMPAMLEKLEKAVALTSGKAGYAVGEKITYADIAIFSLIKDCTIKSDEKDTLKAAENCALLLSIADKIASESNVSKWIESRPETMF